MSVVMLSTAEVTEAVARLGRTQEEPRKSLAEEASEDDLKGALETQTRVLSLFRGGGFKQDLQKLLL